jgi:hypothetical protein
LEESHRRRIRRKRGPDAPGQFLGGGEQFLAGTPDALGKPNDSVRRWGGQSVVFELADIRKIDPYQIRQPSLTDLRMTPFLTQYDAKCSAHVDIILNVEFLVNPIHQKHRGMPARGKRADGESLMSPGYRVGVDAIRQDSTRTP